MGVSAEVLYKGTQQSNFGFKNVAGSWDCAQGFVWVLHLKRKRGQCKGQFEFGDNYDGWFQCCQ